MHTSGIENVDSRQSSIACRSARLRCQPMAEQFTSRVWNDVFFALNDVAIK
jgi:hypothetical protein